MLRRRLSEARGISFYGGSGLFAGKGEDQSSEREREDILFNLFVIGTSLFLTCLGDYSP
jgi:hypothetical protein